MPSRAAPRRTVYVRRIRTPDLHELAAAQPDKNRRYVQLQPGPMEGDLLDAGLGNAQIFRERLDVGMLVEAAPATNLVPFGVVLSSRCDLRFCGGPLQATDLAQATGGEWHIRFDGPLDYVSWVFERSWFEREVPRLLRQPPPANWFCSSARPAAPRAVACLGAMIARILDRLAGDPSLLERPRVRRNLEADILRTSVAALTSADGVPAPLARYGSRQRGVRRAIEYLRDHPDPDQTIPALCDIAGVSERTLEYGFREQLGVSPVRYLKLLRLNGARRDLLRALPRATTVTEVAVAWGFLELGRFAGEYRQFFGELPSATLQRCA